MKNYRDNTPKFRCANCNNCFVASEHDEYEAYFCTDGAGDRPLCGSVLMGECPDGYYGFGKGDEYNPINEAFRWDKWSKGRRVGENGFCEHYEKVAG